MGKIKKLLKKALHLDGDALSKPGNDLLNNVYGHYLTKAQGRPVTKDGSVIPWYTYPAIEFLEQYDLSGKHIFEWGSGNSSIFFSSRAASVTSIEHDRNWYDTIYPTCKENQELKYFALEAYPGAIRNYRKKFDIIVIDGQRRFDCVKECLPFLKDDGLIILDNSDWFYVSAAYLREKAGLLQADFHGFGPINDYTWTTSFFFTKDFRFPLKKGRQPVNPSGGLLHDEMDIIGKEDSEFNTQNLSWVKNQFR